MLTIAGVVVDGPSKGHESGPNIRVQRIGDRVSQQDTQIRLLMDRPRLELGATYELEGYETGEFVGVPAEAFKRGGIMPQTSAFHFSHHFVYHLAKSIPPIAWRPAELLGQRALLAGTAVQTQRGPALQHADGEILLQGASPWKPWQLGKEAEAMGVLQAETAERSFLMTTEFARLPKLADNVGHQVSLRGIALSRNGLWWFNYRGEELHVDDMKHLPGWSGDQHFTTVEISGVLAEDDLPDISQFTLKQQPDLKRGFVVRTPTWQRIDGLLFPERHASIDKPTR